MSKGWFLLKWIWQPLNSPACKHKYCHHEGTSWFDLELTKPCSGRSSLLWWRWPALSLLVFLPGAAKWCSGETWEWCQKASEAKIWQKVGGEWQEVKCESEDTCLFGHSTIICAVQKLQGDMKALWFILVFILFFWNNLLCLPVYNWSFLLPSNDNTTRNYNNCVLSLVIREIDA